MKIAKLSEQSFEEREGYERVVLYDSDDFDNNTKIQLMRLAPLQSISPHYHKERTECFRIVSGEGEIIINDQVVATTPDDVVLCKPNDTHEFINKSASEYLLFQVIRTNDPSTSDMYWVA